MRRKLRPTTVAVLFDALEDFCPLRPPAKILKKTFKKKGFNVLYS